MSNVAIDLVKAVETATDDAIKSTKAATCDALQIVKEKPDEARIAVRLAAASARVAVNAATEMATARASGDKTQTELVNKANSDAERRTNEAATDAVDTIDAAVDAAFGAMKGALANAIAGVTREIDRTRRDHIWSFWMIVFLCIITLVLVYQLPLHASLRVDGEINMSVLEANAVRSHLEKGTFFHGDLAIAGARTFFFIYFFGPAVALTLAVILALRDRTTRRRLSDLEDQHHALLLLEGDPSPQLVVAKALGLFSRDRLDF